MSSRKSANRLPFGRDEGIWRALGGADWHPHKVRCSLCNRTLSTSRLALSSHAKRHVREGLARSVAERDGDGYPRTVYMSANGEQG